MGIDRRKWLKTVGVGAATVAGVPTALSAKEVEALSDDEAVGLLYDTTLCIGCQACVVACREANGDEKSGPHAVAINLDQDTRKIIYAARSDEGGFLAYMKRQCMHCADPACVSACMFGSMRKDPERGQVWWKGDMCVGCRYCQIACPFGIPRFEWDSANPEIVKCELCRHRTVEGPACAEVCPRDAVITGTRAELLKEARRRLAEHPDRYVPRIYGEYEAGGTQNLYLSHVPFEDLGLPEVGERPLPDYTEKVHGLIWKGAVIPSALYALLGIAVFRSSRAHREGDE